MLRQPSTLPEDTRWTQADDSFLGGPSARVEITMPLLFFVVPDGVARRRQCRRRFRRCCVSRATHPHRRAVRRRFATRHPGALARPGLEAKRLRRGRGRQPARLGVAQVAKAAPDGYSLAMAGDAALLVDPALYPDLAISALDDLSPVSQLSVTPTVLVVGKDVPSAQRGGARYPRTRATGNPALRLGRGRDVLAPRTASCSSRPRGSSSWTCPTSPAP